MDDEAVAAAPHVLRPVPPGNVMTPGDVPRRVVIERITAVKAAGAVG